MCVNHKGFQSLINTAFVSWFSVAQLNLIVLPKLFITLVFGGIKLLAGFYLEKCQNQV